MTIKIYTEAFPEDILEQLKKLFLIGNKDQVTAIYVNTFLGKVKDANILTDEKLITLLAKINNKFEKNVISLKKIKDITYVEKGIFGTITYQLSMKKNFELQLNRKDGEEFFKLSLEAWEKIKQRPIS
ncbi:MAG: hypothetical protein VR72_19050 [Clostridiaceae bacterium BRH_c20a]|nr:MAG: hypothetical protein VR72_19050 [Clostridiaceae bacterium BRH_c20a]